LGKSITIEKPLGDELWTWAPGPMSKVIRINDGPSKDGSLTLVTNVGVGTLITEGRNKGSILFTWTNELGKTMTETMTNKVAKLAPKSEDANDGNLATIDSITLDEARRILQDLVALTGKPSVAAVKPAAVKQ